MSATPDRVAIVTGGAGSIGTKICDRLAASGYRICVADLNGERVRQTVTALGGNHFGFAGDLSDESNVEALVAEASSKGTLTVVVNAAGISPKSPHGKLELSEISAEDFMRVMAVNTLAPFLLAKHSYPEMPYDGTASIINILSIAIHMASGGPRGAVFPPFISSASHYGASKAALHNLQISLSRELAPYQIRVNGVAPGFIATDLNANIPVAERAQVLNQIPMARAGTPEDIAEVVNFLAGPGAAYMTGAVLDVNGGWQPA